LDEETKTALKSVDEAKELSIQARAAADAASAPGVWWFSRPVGEWDVSPWWSPQRDQDLRNFVKKEGNDILAGAVSSMVKKFRAMNWTLDGPKATVSRMQEVLAEAEFGKGWSTLIGKTVEDYLVTDRGAFWELIGGGDPDKPLEGLPVGVAHLDSLKCTLTGDPDYPVLFMAAKDGKAHKLHATRVVHFADMESPNANMHGVGYSSVSRVVASSQILLLLAKYKREKLDDLPQAGLLILNNIVPQKWEAAQAQYEMERRRLGNEIWANIMTLIGVDPAQPADAKFISFANIPDSFNERESVATYVNIVALAFGVDVREFWPAGTSSSLGTATESEVMHRKAKGKMVGDLMSTIERAVNWHILPKRVHFKFDNVDSEEDELRAKIEDQKITSIMKMYVPDPVSGETVITRQEIRQILADNVNYFPESFLDVDLTDEVEAVDTERVGGKQWIEP